MIDTSLVTREIIFPVKFPREKSTLLYDSMTGLYLPIKRGVRGRPSIVIEVFKDAAGLHHLISFPKNMEPSVTTAIINIIPGVGIEERSVEPRRWTRGFNIVSHTDLVDEDGKPIELNHEHIPVILGNIGSANQEGDTAIVQWIITPTGYEGKFLAAARIAVSTHNSIRDLELLEQIMRPYRNLQVFHFRSLRTAYDLAKVSNRSAPMQRWPTIIKATDLGVVTLLPIDGPATEGMTYNRGHKLPADSRIEEGPIKLGVSNYPSSKRMLGIDFSDAVRHKHVFGSQGFGKSTFMKTDMHGWATAGRGFVYVDPHADSGYKVADWMPSNRIKDVIFCDFVKGGQYPVGINLLEGEPERVASQMLSVFGKLSNIQDLVIAPTLLRNAALTLAYNKLTLLEMRLLLDETALGKRVRARLVKNVPNVRVQAFWNEFDAMEPKRAALETAALKRRLEPFESWDSLWGSLGQAESRFNFDDVLTQNKIVVIILDMGEEFLESSQLIGSLLLSRLFAAVRRRQRMPEDMRTPYGLFVDEVHNFAKTASFSTVLDEMRKMGLAFTMANQRLDQLGSELKDAAISNALNKAYFHMSSNDARTLSADIDVIPEMLTGLGKHQAIVRLMSDGEPTRPASIDTLAPPKPLNHLHAVRTASQLQYGTDLAQVRRGIDARHALLTESEKPLRLVHREEDDE